MSLFHCLPSIPQQLLKGFCSKRFFGNLFRIQIAFSHELNILGDQVPRLASKSLFTLKWNGSAVPQALTGFLTVYLWDKGFQTCEPRYTFQLYSLSRIIGVYCWNE